MKEVFLKLEKCVIYSDIFRASGVAENNQLSFLNSQTKIRTSTRETIRLGVTLDFFWPAKKGWLPHCD